MHSSNKDIKVIIFDFDGVIADSFNVYYRLNKKAMAHIGLELSRTQYGNLFDTNIYAGFAAYINDHIKFTEFSHFKSQNTKLNSYSDVNIFPGIKLALEQLGSKYKLAIASASSSEKIYKFLKNYEVIDYFQIIEGSNVQTKKIMIQTIVDKSNVQASEALMVSDTIGDLVEARELGLKIAAVSWGFQKKNKLKSILPDFYFQTPEELSRLPKL